MKLTTKAILISTVTTISAFCAVLSTSCNSDKCKTVVCANRGICNGGSCTCPSGYEGTNCETITRKKFTGNWSVFEKGSASLAKQYQLNIVDGESVTYVNILNFNNLIRTPVRAYVDGDKLIIPNQQIQGKVVFGEGVIHSNVTYGQYGGITMKYMVQDSATLAKDDYGYEAALDFSDPSNWNK